MQSLGISESSTKNASENKSVNLKSQKEHEYTTIDQKSKVR